MEFLQGIFNRIKSWFTGIWEKTEKRDRTRFLVISGVAVVLLIAAIVVLNNSRYTHLVGFNNQMEVNTAVGILRENGIIPRTSGNNIQVLRDDHAAANAALMTRSEVNFDADWSIYANAMGLTSTSADRREMSRIQLQNDLGRYLRTLNQVDHAGVLISIPDNSRGIFTGEQEPMSMGVILHLNSPLDETQINAMESFMASSIGIAPENITIMDGNSRPLNGRSDGSPGTMAHQRYELRRTIEDDFDRRVMALLGPVYGPSNLTVITTVELDWDETVTEIQEFTPVVDDEGIPRSIQTVHEYARGSSLTGGFPGTDENGLGMDFTEYPELMDQFINEWRRDAVTTNYEINQTLRRINSEQGRLVERRVAIIINTDGILEPTENTAAVRELAGTAMGLRPAEWPSNVSVQYMPLNNLRIQQQQQDQMTEDERRQQTFNLIQTLVLYGIIGLCLILLIWRTFAFLKPQVIEIPAEIIAGDADEYADLLQAAASADELEITKTPTRERIEEFVDSHPEAVANMLRSWLQEEEENRW
jgi:flagellar M-ring protein FliF